MKMWILALVMVMGVSVSAQQRGDRPERLKPEQRAELQAKKMTLALNLNDKQQKDLKTLLAGRNTKAEAFRAERKIDRQAGKKMTADERFALKSKMLDEQIATKAEMKKILTPEQFEKWESLEKERQEKMVRKHRNFKKHQRR